MKIIFISVTAVMFLYSTISAAVSDSFWNNSPMIITALTGLVIAGGGVLIKFWTFLRSIKKDVAVVHTLVNGNLGLQLKLNAGNARRVAMLTKLPEDIKAAKEAEDLLADHSKQEAIVRSGVKTDEPK